MIRLHRDNPADAVEAAYFRIFQERLADLPIHNPALSVAAVDFQPWQGHWLGALVTPWCLSLLLLPGQEAGWEMPGDNQRRFVRFPAGDFAFLAGREPELGEYQSCALFSQMGQFHNQSSAEQTARAALGVLLAPPAAAEAQSTASPAAAAVGQAGSAVPRPPGGDDAAAAATPASPARRRLFGLGR
jgi:[NiFe] hydrogenase assembly HybE family chaperone